MISSRSHPGLKTKAEEVLLVCNMSTSTGSKSSFKFSTGNICGQKIGQEDIEISFQRYLKYQRFNFLNLNRIAL